MVKLAIGMKVTNVETDQDITNGAHGTIMDVILHPDETYSKEERDMVLKNVPLYLLVKLEHMRATPLKGLEAAVTSVEFARLSRTMEINHSEQSNSVNFRLQQRAHSRKQSRILWWI